MAKRRVLNMITLGCSKNVVDSEHLMAHVESVGYDIIFDEDCSYADVVVINTCGFIGDAKQESVDMILQAVEAKRAGVISRLYVVGCLSERYADALREEVPEVDDYFGVHSWAEVVRELGGEYSAERESERLLSTPSHYAYLKISEGCNWHCGYCAIPLIRGRHISVPMEQLLLEAQSLAAKGVKELIVIAQDTTYYGIDLYGKRRLAELLESLCRIEGIEWIRLHYAYPSSFPRDVIDVMAREAKICSYLDIPFQHISDSQLKSMKRRHTKEQALDLIDQLRLKVPNIALRTTMLVGYPGESEADFEELCQFIRDTRFDRLGVFAYSPEEGTHSANELSDDVPDEVKQQRVEQIMTIQNSISLELNSARVGQILRVIVDREEPLEGDDGEQEIAFLRSAGIYLSLIRSIDKEIGRVLDTLEECGEADNTIIVFTTDHGEMLGSHSVMGKNSIYDESFLVPFIISYPGVIEPRTDDLLLGSVDIMPTLLSMMGLKDMIPNSVAGVDYSQGVMTGEYSNCGKPKTALYLFPSRKGVRSDRYTYGVDKNGGYHLFDNHADPYQMRSIKLDDIPTEDAEMLKRELGEWLKVAQDSWFSERICEKQGLITYPL